VTKEIGPNLLESAIYLEKNGKYQIPFSLFKEIYRSRKAQNKQLCQALLDQSLISGIGNYLKCEILYACRLAPDRLVKDCSDLELKRIWRIGHKTILKAYKYNGLTIRTYVDLAGKLGHFPVIVYRRAGEYTRSGHLIVYSKFKDGRGTYWVPDVQT
jgi:formamidopyrimidine-DNA glycosylase